MPPVGFDWQALPAGSLVVDVGGGVGSQTLTLAKAFNHLKYVVQDRAAVISGSAVQVSLYLQSTSLMQTLNEVHLSSGKIICRMRSPPVV